MVLYPEFPLVTRLLRRLRIVAEDEWDLNPPSLPKFLRRKGARNAERLCRWRVLQKSNPQFGCTDNSSRISTIWHVYLPRGITEWGDGLSVLVCRMERPHTQRVSDSSVGQSRPFDFESVTLRSQRSGVWLAKLRVGGLGRLAILDIMGNFQFRVSGK